MKKLTLEQQGFIPLLLTVLALVIGLIALAYMRVAHAGS